MPEVELAALVIGILAGVAFGIYWASRKLKKGKRNIPEEILKDFNEKEVQENSSKESNKENSSSKDSRGSGRRRFFRFGRRAGGGDSTGRTGLANRDGTSIRDRGGEPNIETSNINSTRTESIEGQPSIPIQSTSDNERDEPVNPRSKRNSKKRNKRNRFNPIE